MSPPAFFFGRFYFGTRAVLNAVVYKVGENQIPDAGRASGLLAALLMLVLVPAFAAAKSLEKHTWIEIRTQNFRIRSLLNEKDSLETARRIQAFHAAASIVTGFAGSGDQMPSEIYVLKKPRNAVHLGMPRAESSASFNDAWLHTIVVGNVSWEDSNESLRHAYAHQFVRGRFPMWLETGLAEYLTPERYWKHEGYVTIGLPPYHKMRWLRRYKPWIPMQEMLSAADRYDDWLDRKQAMFFSESWVLFHYLVNKPGYTDNIAKYLALFDAGQDSLPAFEASFGVTGKLLNKEIRNYLRRSKFAYHKFDMEELLGSFEPEVVTLSPEQISLGLAGIALAFKELDRAQYWFDVAITDDRIRPRAEAGMGQVLLRRGEHDSARERFEMAIALAPDDAYTQIEMGRYWKAQAGQAKELAHRETLFERARAHFTRARELDDTIPEGYALHGETFVTQGDFDKAIELLETANSLWPSSPKIRVLLAESYAGVDRRDEAIRIARSVLAWTSYKDKLVARARKVLAAVEEQGAEQQ